MAGPPLLLLGAGRASGAAAGGSVGRPHWTGREAAGRGPRVGLTSARIYEGEPVAVDVSG